jgi:GT2 family glycosyltransferase
MLGIIIINYNTYNKTIECINSIKRTYDGEYRIYLLDNASPNESGEKLSEEYENDDKVCLILSETNHGYARGNNLCLKKAVEDGCKYVIISNNDIVYKDDAIRILLEEITGQKALLVGPKVIKPSGVVQSTAKMRRPGFFSYLMHETYLVGLLPDKGRKYKSVPEESTDVYWIAGCTFIVDVEQFKTLDFFDEYTFLYFEEYIIAEKARKKGLKLRYCPNAEVLHYHGVSMGGTLNITTRSTNWRSEAYFVKTYWHWGIIKMWLLWQMRVLEIRFNARHSSDRKQLVEKYREGKKYLKR